MNIFQKIVHDEFGDNIVSHHHHHICWKEFLQTRLQKYLDLRHHLPKVFVASAQKYFSPRGRKVFVTPARGDKTKAALQAAVRRSWLGCFEPKCKINVGIFTFAAKCNLSLIAMVFSMFEKAIAAGSFYCIKFSQNEPSIVWMGLPMQQPVDLLKRLLL